MNVRLVYKCAYRALKNVNPRYLYDMNFHELGIDPRCVPIWERARYSVSQKEHLMKGWVNLSTHKAHLKALRAVRESHHPETYAMPLAC